MVLWTEILLLILGLVLVVAGADFLVDGASAIARKFKVSEFIIGLTIVGFGTSCPELVVSLTGAISGSADISMGNIVGSNIFNTLLILGLTAMIAPIAIKPDNRRRDIPINIVASIIFVIIAVVEAEVTRIDSFFMIFLFALYIAFCFIEDIAPKDDTPHKEMGIPLAVFLTVAGLAALIIGGDLLVDKGQAIARAAGVSDKFIAVTLLAGGTSLPELATCIVAAAKGKGQLALGNILGSNIFNMFLVIGLAGSFAAMPTVGMDWFDWGALIAAPMLLLLFSYTGSRARLNRFEGFMLLLAAAAYFTHLIINI